MSDLDKKLREFEAIEANLTKLEKSWKTLQNTTEKPTENLTHENACRSYGQLLTGLPAIDNWKPTTLPLSLDEITEERWLSFSFAENTSINPDLDRRIEQPGKELREYRYKFNRARRQFVRDEILKIFNEVQHLLDSLQEKYPINEAEIEWNKKIDSNLWLHLKDKFQQIDKLLGSSISRPPRWHDLHRHLHYAERHDLRDIILTDWPSVKNILTGILYSSDESIPVSVNDISDLISPTRSGTIITRLKWDVLSPEDFERLIFCLISSQETYENPQWLTKTNAPDRGRDISAEQVYKDKLTGVTRRRVIIQCKHWLTRSIAPKDFAEMKEQIKLWEPPRVDILVIATSGRFTSDCIDRIEQHNQSDSPLTLMWADSHLEKILADHPSLITEFGLR